MSLIAFTCKVPLHQIILIQKPNIVSLDHLFMQFMFCLSQHSHVRSLYNKSFSYKNLILYLWIVYLCSLYCMWETSTCLIQGPIIQDHVSLHSSLHLSIIVFVCTSEACDRRSSDIQVVAQNIITLYCVRPYHPFVSYWVSQRYPPLLLDDVFNFYVWYVNVIWALRYCSFLNF